MDSLFKTELSRTNGHPSEDELLLYVDGELAPKATNQVSDHLEACWSCRVRTEKVEETISTFIDYRNQVLKPLVEQPPHHWQGFDRKLNCLAREIGRPSLFANVRGALGRILPTQNLSLNPRVLLRPIAVAVVLIILAAFFIRFNRTPVVSASELLGRATEAQQRTVNATNQAVVHQRIEVKRKAAASLNPETVIWEVWNDISNSRSRHSVEEPGGRNFVDPSESKSTRADQTARMPESLSSLVNVLRANHMNPATPLSAASFDAWRRSVEPRHDEVAKIKLADGNEAFTLTTISIGQVSDGQIVEGAIVVRAGDWHSVEEHLRVKGDDGDQEFELIETAYSVLSLVQIDPKIFLPEPVGAKTIPSPSTANTLSATPNDAVAPVQPPIPALATADLEVEILRLLHGARADLGEQITTSRQSDGLVHVTGIVDTAERKAEIMRALQPVANNPACRIEIQTVPEAVAAQNQQRVRSKATPAPVTEQNVEIQTETIAAAPELRRHFGTDEQVREFSARMVSQSRSAMRHVYALKRLIAQFSPGELRTLSPETKSKWLSLIRAHASAYQNEIASLKRELEPIFSPSSSGADVIGTAIDDDASLARAVEQLFGVAGANDGVIRSTFATSSSGAAITAIGSPQFWQSMKDAESLSARIARTR